MKSYSVDKAHKWGQHIEGEFVLLVQDEDDSQPHLTTVRGFSEIEMRDIANLLNLAPEILRHRAKSMSWDQVGGKHQDGSAA